MKGFPLMSCDHVTFILLESVCEKWQNVVLETEDVSRIFQMCSHEHTFSLNPEIMTQNLALAKCLLPTHSKCSLSKRTHCAADNYWFIDVYHVSVAAGDDYNYLYTAV